MIKVVYAKRLPLINMSSVRCNEVYVAVDGISHTCGHTDVLAIRTRSGAD